MFSGFRVATHSRSVDFVAEKAVPLLRGLFIYLFIHLFISERCQCIRVYSVEYYDDK